MQKRKFNRMTILNTIFLSTLGLVLVGMLSSFIMRMSKPPIDSTVENEIAKTTIEEVIQINVLNACGTSGLASSTQHYLRSRGFDVVEIGNITTASPKSKVIDRIGDRVSATKVAYALGIPDSMVVTQLDSNMYLRATVIIGNDYKGLNPFK